ncbi:ATP-binding protein [Aliikangiella coralliicola]|uniref:histidine kinase n=1 Tax=Aliikangiella coralliicola TaxID=2592383 RepID=A0A545U4X1_9GAMM|nr:ATP-binding protein [Aliikangiella coralliicola]TQV84517.1 hypothetical protein FLL46_23165 [Aliikangiella coralliicola]
MESVNPARWSLRAKFTSIVLLVLLIPVAAVVLLKEVEKALVENLKHNLLLSSRLVSLQLEANQSWFTESILPDSQNFVADELFVFPLNQPVLLDGFFEEWLFIEKFRQSFKTESSASQQGAFSALLASYDKHLYLSIEIDDESIIYPEPDLNYFSDQITIDFLDNESGLERIYISPRAPGNIPVKKFADGEIRIDWRYSAVWQETNDGFNLELKFPSGYQPKQLRITYLNVNNKGLSEAESVVSTSQFELSPVVWPSTNINHFVSELDLLPGQRVWVLDPDGRVLARNGNLQNIPLTVDTNPLVNWLLSSQATEVIDRRDDRVRLDSTVIFESLKGRPSSSVESSKDGSYSIALASTPILVDSQVIGAVFIEENVARVQLLQRKTLGQMLYVMTIIFLAILALVVWYVSRVTLRVSRLKNRVNQVVDEQGRMLAPMEIEAKVGDEIDDLTNAFIQMGNKLFDYNDYLEKLASMLSHELRTPIAIVRSSLDNLLINTDDAQAKETIQRALQGTQRLGEIIRRMRQATGIKEAMQSAQFEQVDLVDFVNQVIAGFQHSFADYQFKFESEQKQLEKSVSTDLLAELLDKLLSNAMDFSSVDAPIIIGLERSDNQVTLSVTNSGPTIPRKNQKKIFQSLVSIRNHQQPGGANAQKVDSHSPNLGLGLYVVKLIADFHEARVKAENLADESGVKFSLTWQL